MKNDSSGTGFAIVMVLSFFLIIGLIVDAMEPKCIKIGCDNPRADGSCYCYFHKGSTYDHTYKYSGSSSSGNKKSTFSLKNLSPVFQRLVPYAIRQYPFTELVK